ncbi:MAG: hypothetical protein ACI8RD_014185, partial [Bacillariaceae sp.]
KKDKLDLLTRAGLNVNDIATTNKNLVRLLHNRVKKDREKRRQEISTNNSI